MSPSACLDALLPETPKEARASHAPLSGDERIFLLTYKFGPIDDTTMQVCEVADLPILLLQRQDRMPIDAMTYYRYLQHIVLTLPAAVLRHIKRIHSRLLAQLPSSSFVSCNLLPFHSLPRDGQGSTQPEAKRLTRGRTPRSSYSRLEILFAQVIIRRIQLHLILLLILRYGGHDRGRRVLTAGLERQGHILLGGQLYLGTVVRRHLGITRRLTFPFSK